MGTPPVGPSTPPKTAPTGADDVVLDTVSTLSQRSSLVSWRNSDRDSSKGKTLERSYTAQAFQFESPNFQMDDAVWMDAERKPIIAVKDVPQIEPFWLDKVHSPTRNESRRRRKDSSTHESKPPRTSRRGRHRRSAPAIFK